MKQILYIFIFIFICIFNIYLSLVLQAQNLTSKNLSTNRAVTLNYWQQINDFFAFNEKLPSYCKTKSIINKHTIICPAWIKILINKKQLLSWQQEQKQHGFIDLYLPKIGIMHEKVKIAKIKKVTPQALINKNQHLVIAIYMRYAHALKYKIKDTNTGVIVEITATPEHKFYETTYKKFIAISKLGPDNTLLSASNHYLKIICNNNRQNNCGTVALNSLQKTYNIEVKKAHNYFVDNIKILVHNGCYDHYYRCRSCKDIHRKIDMFSDECPVTANKKHNIRIHYQCEFCGMTDRIRKQVTKHKAAVHEKKSTLLVCDVCDANFETPRLLAYHEAMHKKNDNSLFCGDCDRMISLKDKLDDDHMHSLPEQHRSSIEQSFFRERSRSPISGLVNNQHLLELPNYDK